MDGSDGLYKAIDQDFAQQRQKKERLEQERRRDEAWDKTWLNVVVAPTVEIYLDLGTQLKERRCGLWLDWREVCLVRSRWVLERNLLPGYVFVASTYGFCGLANRLLKFAFIGDAGSIESEMQRARDNSVMGNICSVTHDLKDEAEKWLNPKHCPLTPYLSRSELAEAVRGKIKGMGNPSGISRAIDDRRLEVEGESQPDKDGKRRYARFRHKDPAVHREMLQLAVERLKKTQNGISFFGPCWTAEIDGLKG